MEKIVIALTPTQQAANNAEQSGFLLDSAASNKTTALHQHLLRELA